ncbi:MAG: alpha/beta hydrolase [Candidatus Micrarchaeota archaeon]
MRHFLMILVSGLLLFGCLGPAEAGQPPPAQPQQPQEINVPTDATPAEPEQETPVAQPEAPESTPEPEPEAPPAETEGYRSREISYKTQDAWEIHGTLYYADLERPETAIILLHGYGQDRSSWDPLVPVLRERLSDMDLVVLDMRGHGESDNINPYDKLSSGELIAMDKDIAGAIPYLQTIRPDLEAFYLVGASIGSSAAIKYAVNDNRIKKVVMISPGLEYRGVRIERYTGDYIRQLYLTAAYGDEYSRNSADDIYDESPSDEKELKIYYEAGNAHGTELFAATANTMEPLTELIADWLQK